MPARRRILLEQLHQQLLLVRQRIVEELDNLVGVEFLVADVLLAAEHAVEVVDLLADLAGANFSLLDHCFQRFGFALRALLELSAGADRQMQRIRDVEDRWLQRLTNARP